LERAFKKMLRRFRRDQLEKDELVDGLEKKVYSGVDCRKD